MNIEEKIIGQSFSKKDKCLICKMIENGVTIFKAIQNEKAGLFGSDLTSNISTRLLGYCVLRQFAPDMILDSVNFESHIQSVNSFGYKIVELSNKRVIVHIANSKSMMPSKSKYKLKLANQNDFENSQIIMDVFKNNIVGTKELPNYAFVSYYVDKQFNIKHIDIVIPNYNMSEIIYSEDIYNEYKKMNFEDDINEKDNIEKKIVTIKAEIQQQKNIL